MTRRAAVMTARERVLGRAVLIADIINHRTRPGHGTHWSATLCLWASETAVWLDGLWPRRPSLRSAWRTHRHARAWVSGRETHPGEDEETT